MRARQTSRAVMCNGEEVGSEGEGGEEGLEGEGQKPQHEST